MTDSQKHEEKEKIARKRMKAGKAFEQLTTAIQQHVNSNADVVPNAPLTDICGILREIDVLVTLPTSSGKQEIAFECRDHKRKVGVFDIDSFISKYHDLPQIDKIVVVSNSGFNVFKLSSFLICISVSPSPDAEISSFISINI